MRAGRAVVAAALALLLTGCAQQVPLDQPATMVPGAAADLLPTVWHVHGAAGEGTGGYLLADADQLTLLRPKGEVTLGWQTQGDAMLTMVQGWSMTLGTKHPPTVPWLTSATRFVRDGTGWALLDAQGRTTAVLHDDGPAPASSQGVTTPDPVTSRVRAQMADAALGSGVGRVDPAAIEGTWTLPGADVTTVHARFAASGAWTASSGCVALAGHPGDGGFGGGAGDYRLLPDGALLMVSDADGSPGCGPIGKPLPGIDAVAEIGSARSARLHDGRLTLYDRTGTALGTLVRATSR